MTLFDGSYVQVLTVSRWTTFEPIRNQCPVFSAIRLMLCKTSLKLTLLTDRWNYYYCCYYYIQITITTSTVATTTATTAVVLLLALLLQLLATTYQNNKPYTYSVNDRVVPTRLVIT